MEEQMNFKSPTVLLTALFVSIVIVIIWQLKYDLRKDSEEIKVQMLNKTPIGMSFDEVVSKLKSKNFNPEIYNNKGFFKHEYDQYPITIGRSSIEVFLGDYIVFPFYFTSVTAFWGFDKEGKLIEIWVRKTTDGL